jgi:tetratricopeptide (TPR) repeat protein
MKRMVWIGIVVFLVVAACNRPDNDLVETRRATSRIDQVPEPAVPEDHRRVEEPSHELSAIDSLMWRQPDSALARLIPYFDTCCRDAKFCVSTTTTFNRHYANLLLSELLYKNDYAQTNRPTLLQAVHYFDSLVREAPPFKGGGGIKKGHSSNPNLAFLDARSHYINGVGYYENDSVVPACAEYLKALEMMESRFDGKDLVGKKARFMTYTYNRLGELFEEQYMMGPTLDCYRHSYDYSVISPISSYSVSNALYRIGKQYNMKGEKDSANYYYTQALVNIPDSTNPYYRDMVSTKALLSYQLTHQAEMSLERLKQMAVLAEDDDERLTRYMVIGNIFFEEGMYDSALLYLEPVLENKENRSLKIQVANYLRIIYDSLGNHEKSNECMHYLALHNETGAENSAMVSQLSEIYKTYKSRKQEKEAVAKREVAVKKVLGIVIPMAVILALAIIVMAKWRSRKLLKEQREESDRVLGEKEQQHRMQQAALSGRLKRSNEELRDLSKQLKQSLTKNPQYESDASNDYAAFINDPICKHIVGVAHKQQFKSKMDYLIYKDDALSKEQLLDLRNAVQKHLPRFVSHIRRLYQKLTDNDMDYCYLFLLGLNEADISALMQRAYTTVCDRSRKISRIIGAHDSLYHVLRDMLDE